MKKSRNSKGQIWVETVIYLLIAFVMIGLVLSFVRPKIEELRDKTIIEQSINVLEDIDGIISTIGSAGNKRILEVGLRKGSLIIDGVEDKIIFQMEGAYVFSEPGSYVQAGGINASTVQKGKYYLVKLERDYSEKYNLTYNGEDSSKALTRASTGYSISISNDGKDSNDKKIINFELE